ncbi:MAG: MarR family transcriptional regulator, partial [Proteobacteria bacterium]|nr:MarR family transcriptional regulator [Pseudomonadota bacterium]
MGQLSGYIMVSNGNVTAVVNRLLQDGWILRTTDKNDRRVATVRLSRKGRQIFLKMAAVHEQWIDHMFQDLSEQKIEDLMGALAQMRLSIETHEI